MKSYTEQKHKLRLAIIAANGLSTDRLNSDLLFKVNSKGDIINNKDSRLSVYLDAIDACWDDKFSSPFILDTILEGNPWANQFGNTPKKRLIGFLYRLAHNIKQLEEIEAMETVNAVKETA